MRRGLLFFVYKKVNNNGSITEEKKETMDLYISIAMIAHMMKNTYAFTLNTRMNLIFLRTQVSMTRKCYNHRPPTSPWHHEVEAQNT